MNRLLLAALLLPLLALPALGAGNLVVNGSFERVDDQKKPEYWHYRLTDFMPQTTRNEEDGTRTYRYICGCGHDLGPAKPWAGLLCPKCKGFMGGEEAGAWYRRNHERVSIDRGAKGNGVKFTLDTSTGNNQGVRIYSRLIKARRGWGYKLKFSCRAYKSHPRVFVECYREIKAGGSRFYSKYMTDVPKELDPDGTRTPIERVFRAHVNCETSPRWKTYTKEFVAPERYQFDWMTVKLYAYMPGEAWFDNVVLVPMSAKEMRDYYKGKRDPKDSRFKHDRSTKR